MCLTTSTALRIEPALPLTISVNQTQIFTWFRTDDHSPPNIDLRAIPITGSQTQSLKNHDYVTGSRTTPSVDIRSTLPVEHPGSENGTVSLTFTSATSFLIVGVRQLVPKESPFFTASGAVLVTIGTTSNAHTETTQTSATSTTTDASTNTLSMGSPMPMSTPTVPPTTAVPSTSIFPTSQPIFPPSQPIFPTSQPENARPHKSNPGAITGGVLGGLVVLVVATVTLFFILKRRKKKLKHNLDPTPYLDTTPSSSSDAPYINIREQKMQMIAQRERLERELDAYEQSSRESDSTSRGVPDDINDTDHVVQVLRRQMEVLTQRIATVEAGMAPPDYSSGTVTPT
ncbi:hypothetical protein E1B28_013009 [Marasmius oreades]|uniref:Uncharacterized protein n=1 Tax=Marasmius oreades TaxID=181124 RepID=A0A9P7RP17_9AGAR|nr:uncharacterized protein E1B28_013009 [Marasmius oreades]KAG7087030.1 hypothetical protein E1B28_013009 [Marasmius oreades]